VVGAGAVDDDVAPPKEKGFLAAGADEDGLVPEDVPNWKRLPAPVAESAVGFKETLANGFDAGEDDPPLPPAAAVNGAALLASEEAFIIAAAVGRLARTRRRCCNSASDAREKPPLALPPSPT